MKTFRFIAALIFISIAGTALAGNGHGYRNGGHRAYAGYRGYGGYGVRSEWRRHYARPYVNAYYYPAPVVVAPPVAYYDGVDIGIGFGGIGYYNGGYRGRGGHCGHGGCYGHGHGGHGGYRGRR